AGPLLVEAHVVRIDSLSSSDDQTKYRTEEELEAIRQRDPIAYSASRMLTWGVIDEAGIRRMHTEVQAMVNAAAVEAEGAPTYASTELVTMVDAINHGLREEMERNTKIVMWGEDVADPKGGVFGVTRGLTHAFPDRVENSPLAEASI